MSLSDSKSLLHRLARLYNIQPAYHDAFGRYVESSPDAMLSVLKILDAPLEKMTDLPDALRQRRKELWQRRMDPVLIVWDGLPVSFNLRLPAELGESDVSYHLKLEGGGSREGPCQENRRRATASEFSGERYVRRRLSLPEKVDPGYHRLEVRSGGMTCSAHLISSFIQTYTPDGQKPWGIFCPLYSLSSAQSWGAGDFSDLRAMIDLTTEAGGQVAGTLPLLPAFLDEPFNPSPYAPVSRRFWNEFYLDIEQIPEVQSCGETREIIESPSFQRELKDLKADQLIDYRRIMAVKRRVLDRLLGCLAHNSQRLEAFRVFVERHPSVQDYAAFRAKVERERKVWQLWSERSRGGLLTPADYDETAKQYHLYVQWLCHEQMARVAQKARSNGAKLYLDFPLGVNRDGYDVWREPSVFALEASGGAPPDGFFSKGQDWGFPPPHPDGLRRQGYRHYAECLRHHMAAAGMLRVDHILGLHRLYWVPHGFAADQGVYVRYHAEELYAVLSLESHRHQVQIIGENLGTVPPYVNTAMARHDVLGMRVGQFSVRPDPQHAMEEIPPKTAVSLNTHDTPTFMGFWHGGDIEDRVELGLLEESQSTAEREYRAAQREALVKFLRDSGWLERDGDPTETSVLKAWLSYLASGDADLLLVNLEDLWLEPAPQNVPGTWEERPNWRRRARLTLEEISQRQAVTDIFNALKRLRPRSSS